MGEHKHNPTAQKAKEGLLPQKPEKMSKREQDRRLMAMIQGYMVAKNGLPADLFKGL